MLQIKSQNLTWGGPISQNSLYQGLLYQGLSVFVSLEVVSILG